jgi:uncharacterized protein (TIRG00374 family)
MAASSGPSPRPGWRRLLPALISAAILALVVAYVNPAELGRAFSRFEIGYLPWLIVISISYYLLKGWQWHLFLRPLRLLPGPLRTVLIYLAGQPMAVLPLGELTRAFLLRQFAKADLGQASAAVVVQELLYPVGLIAVAIPGAGRFLGAQAAVALALVGLVGVGVILFWDRAFGLTMRLAAMVPVLRRYSPSLLGIHRNVVFIAGRRDSVVPILMGPVAAVIAIAAFYLTVRSVGIELGLYQVAFVYSVAHLAGGVSLLPGGFGAYEGTMTLLLVAFGVPAPVAAAIAILNRAFDRGLVTVVGTAVYLAIRRPSPLAAATLAPDQ